MPEQFTTSKQTFVMLLSHEKFKGFTRKAVAAGGNTYNSPQDHGFMSAHGFQDPDGHLWELMYLDSNAIPTA